ncbi:MAG: NAD(P)/FAD-dependent oxidoreductase [Planctomycetota bacterium]|jgi:protoporphyrinogen oxidase
MNHRKAIIIGAGPAGLTAALEILNNTDIKPIIYETTGDVGGISKTIDYKGNKIDIGGHRFFSKSDRVMQWWLNIMPVQGALAVDDIKLNRNVRLSGEPTAPNPEKVDNVMLVRNRLSRILYQRRFFDYPVSLNLKTFSNLGLWRVIKIALSFTKVSIFPVRPEKSLEDFFINRFGRELYLTFFKDYTEKVWGTSCREIKPDWGAQRIKGLSISTVINHALKSFFSKDSSISQKKTETSLIEQFLYPKFGPGQMWKRVAEIIEEKGGRLYLNHTVTGFKHGNYKIKEVQVKNKDTGHIITQNGVYFFSSMPVKKLVQAMNNGVPENVSKVAQGLSYRDFITVGLLLKKLKIKNDTKIETINDIVPDQWIYIQEKDVKVGRIQIFNNWSPYMVRDENTVWLGLEYFCNEFDQLWNKPDEEFAGFAIDEMVRIGIIEEHNVIDYKIIRMLNVYPAYFGSYDQFDVIRNFTDKFENLFLIGRTGMHRYNNQDHSMLTAITAVENIVNNVNSKDNIWAVNTEEEYHERR